MSEITQLLARSAAGDATAMDQVFGKVYPELRRLAASQFARGQHTLSPTALVHEAYLRLLGNAKLELTDRRHFFACVARAMRNIVVDHLRARNADKRGGGAVAVTLEGLAEADSPWLSPQLLDLVDALDALGTINPRQREVVELHFFAGLGYPEIAELMDCSERTVIRDWQRARAFMHAQLDPARG